MQTAPAADDEYCVEMIWMFSSTELGIWFFKDWLMNQTALYHSLSFGVIGFNFFLVSFNTVTPERYYKTQLKAIITGYEWFNI